MLDKLYLTTLSLIVTSFTEIKSTPADFNGDVTDCFEDRQWVPSPAVVYCCQESYKLVAIQLWGKMGGNYRIILDSFLL